MMKPIILFFVDLLVRMHILTPIRVARLKYFYRLHRWPDFEHPRDLNEKINWMKFYGDTSQWPMLADKYRVREYVKACGLEDCLVPLIGKLDTVVNIRNRYHQDTTLDFPKEKFLGQAPHSPNSRTGNVK